jgi:hypothetical protein
MTATKVIPKLRENATEQSRLDSLSKYLNGRCVMTRVQLAAVDSLDLSLAEQSGTEGRSNKRAGVDLVVGLRNRWKLCLGSINDCESKPVAEFSVASIV